MDNTTLNTESSFICNYQNKPDKYFRFKQQSWNPNLVECLLYIVIEHMCKPH